MIGCHHENPLERIASQCRHDRPLAPRNPQRKGLNYVRFRSSLQFRLSHHEPDRGHQMSALLLMIAMSAGPKSTPAPTPCYSRPLTQGSGMVKICEVKP